MTKVFLNASLAFTILWFVLLVAMLPVSIWAAFWADPAFMSPDSISRASPLSEKLFLVGGNIGMLLFGIVFLSFVVRIRRRVLNAE